MLVTFKKEMARVASLLLFIVLIAQAEVLGRRDTVLRDSHNCRQAEWASLYACLHTNTLPFTQE